MFLYLCFIVNVPDGIYNIFSHSLCHFCDHLVPEVGVD